MKLLPCPQLGPRPVDEFVYGGEDSTTGAVPLAKQFFTNLG